MLRQLKEYREQGMLYKEIAPLLGYEVSAWRQLSRIGYRYGLFNKRNSKRPPVEKVKKLAEKGFSRKEIAKKLKTSTGTIGTICTENRIKTTGNVFFVQKGEAKKKYLREIKKMGYKSLAEISNTCRRMKAYKAGWPGATGPTQVKVLDFLFTRQEATMLEIALHLGYPPKRRGIIAFNVLKKLIALGMVQKRVIPKTRGGKAYFLTAETKRAHFNFAVKH